MQKKVHQIIHCKGYHCDVDESNDRLNKKKLEMQKYLNIIIF